jgi:hypothetical protein
VVFLILYFRGFWVTGTPLLLIAFAIAGLGVLISPRNLGANCFFIYAAAFMGDVGPPATAFVGCSPSSRSSWWRRWWSGYRRSSGGPRSSSR